RVGHKFQILIVILDPLPPVEIERRAFRGFRPGGKLGQRRCLRGEEERYQGGGQDTTHRWEPPDQGDAETLEGYRHGGRRPRGQYYNSRKPIVPRYTPTGPTHRVHSASRLVRPGPTALGPNSL